MAMARATRVALDLSLAACRSLRPGLATAWQYAKVECAPPLTKSFLQGPAGVKIEQAAANAADGIISTIAKVIHDMDVAEAKAKADKIAAAKKKMEAERIAKLEKRRLAALKQLEKEQKQQQEKKAQLEGAAKKGKDEAPKTKDKPKSKSKEKKKSKKPKKDKKAPPKKKK